MWRFLLLAVILAGLAPGTFVRTRTGFSWDEAVVTVTPRPERTGLSGALTLTGAWELASAHGWFGGFSALTAGPDGALIAGTDRGFLFDLDLAEGTPRAVPGSFRFIGIRTRSGEDYVDLESLARDPATGTLWGGFEDDNLIVRWSRDEALAIRAPQSMAGWNLNSGPETMVRLADGSFLVIEEGDHEGLSMQHQALLFPHDPTQQQSPVSSHFKAPEDYDPVDAAQLPGGQLLILLRRVRYTLPARFDTAIAIADPRDIGPQQVWQGRIIQRLDGGIFADNFEGIAFVPSAAEPSRGSVWLISDNNFSVFQRNLLVRFDWPGGALKP